MPPSNRPPLPNVPRSIDVTTTSNHSISNSHDQHFNPQPSPKVSKEKSYTSAPKPDADSVPHSVITKSKRIPTVPVVRSNHPKDVYTDPSEVNGANHHNTNDSTDTSSPSTQHLLHYAKLRVDHQRMKEELIALKSSLATKDEHIFQLTNQLRRATASKCDLVVACHDMEQQMKLVEQYGSPASQQIRQQYLEMLEGRANMEVEFMNELQILTNQLLLTERRYRNELVDKDFTIGQLEEQVRRLKLELQEQQQSQPQQELTSSSSSETSSSASSSSSASQVASSPYQDLGKTAGSMWESPTKFVAAAESE